MHIPSCCVLPYPVSLEHLLLFFPSDESPQADVFDVLFETQGLVGIVSERCLHIDDGWL